MSVREGLRKGEGAGKWGDSNLVERWTVRERGERERECVSKSERGRD
jgi:hypothetical protein